MPRPIPNTTVQTTYTDAATFSFGDVFAKGFIVVANNPVFMQMGLGERGQARWGDEVYITPSSFPLLQGDTIPIAGIRFRAVSAATPLPQVFGSLFYPGEPAISAGTELSSIVNPEGFVPAVNIPTLTQAQFPPANPIIGDTWWVQPNVVTESEVGIGGYRWLVVYEGSGIWGCTGAPLYAQINAAETTTSIFYTDLATLGPSITCPLKGSYVVTVGAQVVTGGANYNLMAYDLGATGANDEWCASDENVAAAASPTRAHAFSTINQGDVIRSKYRVSGGTGTWSRRYMLLQPLKLTP